MPQDYISPHLLSLVDSFLDPLEKLKKAAPGQIDVDAIAAHARPAIVIFVENCAIQFARNELVINTRKIDGLYPMICDAVREEAWIQKSSPELRAFAEAIKNILFNWNDIDGTSYTNRPEVLSDLTGELVPDLLEAALALAKKRKTKEQGTLIARILARWYALFGRADAHE